MNNNEASVKMKFRDMLKRLSRPISLEHLTDYEVYDDGDRFRTGKVILPVGQVNTRTGRIMHNEQVLVSVDTQTGALPSITIGSDGVGIYEILGIHSSCVMAADVADRSVNLRYTPYSPLTYTNNGKWGWISTGITQSSSQQGTIHINQGQQYVYNDNGSVASSAANPLPFLCTGGSIIQVNSTNLKAGDQHSLRVYYRRVGDV